MIILSLLNGSRLYGLAHSLSDYDIINVYMKDRKDYYLSDSDKIKFRKISSLNYEITYIDLITLCKQLLKCNPNFIIPFLEGKGYYYTTAGFTLLENIALFLDYDKVDKAFMGMSQSAFERGKPNDIAKSEYMRMYRERILRDIPDTNRHANTEKIKEMIDSIVMSQH